MAARSAAVIRGARKPLVVEAISRAAVAAGVTVPIPAASPRARVPVKVGEARGALRARAVLVAEEMGLDASEVLSTLARPT